MFPSEKQAVPDTLNWDLFTGPAEMNDFNEIYHSMELAWMVGLWNRCPG